MPVSNYRKEAFSEVVSLTKITNRMFFLTDSDERISRRLRTIHHRLLKITEEKEIFQKRKNWRRALEGVNALKEEMEKEENEGEIEIFCKIIVQIFTEIKPLDGPD